MNLNDEQQAAVEETARPVLVLAGPGTGKTAMMVQKFRHLVMDRGFAPDRILVTTFTRKATEELQERIGAALNDAGHYSKVEVQNFHGFCLRLLRDHPVESGFDEDAAIVDGQQLGRFFHEHRDRFRWDHVPFVRWVHTPLDRLRGFMGACLSAGIGPDDAGRLARAAVDRADGKSLRKANEFLDYAHNYGVALELIRQNRLLTYDLMLYDAVQLLEAHEDIRLTVQDGYDYLLVDEVQDNNGLQARLVEHIAGGRPCVTVVGDEDQGIYKFRGAERGILERFEEHFAPRRIDLFQNYRSSTSIVAAASALIAHNQDRFVGKRLEAAGANKDHPTAPRVTGYRNEEQEVLHLARNIHAAIEAGRRPRDIAVLLRSLNSKGRLLEELEALGVPYEITNVAQLLRLREVRDLWAWMSTLNNPYLDNPAFERVLQSQEVGLPLLELARIQGRFRRIQDKEARDRGEERGFVNLIDILRDLDGPHVDDDARHRLRWLRRTLEILSDKTRGMTALDTAYAVLGWLKPQRRHPPDDPKARQVWHNLGDFLQVIKDYEQSYPGAKGLRGFLEHIDYLDRQGAEFQERQPDVSDDSVKILTAHRAKGLQWPVVFLPACNAGVFPSKNRGDWLAPLLRPDADVGREHIEEERRVFFVAMTRAEQELHMSHALHLNGQERARSVFLDEVLDADVGVNARVEEAELEAAETPESLAEEAAYRTIHEALVTEGADAEELGERARRIVQAAGDLWAGTQDPAGVAAALEPLGYVPPPANEGSVAAGPQEALRLSASALNTYAQCPRKFQFQYVLHVPQKINPSAVAGSNVHRALEEFHKRHKEDWREQDTNSLLATYAEVTSDARFGSEAEAKQWRARDERILGQYLEQERGIPGEPTHFEVPFAMRFEDVDVEFHGYIDRVDEHPDGRLEVVDYKTGSRKTANKIVAEDFQVPLYVAAMEAKGRQVTAGTLYWMKEAGDGDGPIERMRMPRVAEGKPKGEFTDEAMKSFDERVRDTVRAIRAGSFTENPGFHCQFCDYRLLCPAFEDA